MSASRIPQLPSETLTLSFWVWWSILSEVPNVVDDGLELLEIGDSFERRHITLSLGDRLRQVGIGFFLNFLGPQIGSVNALAQRSSASVRPMTGNAVTLECGLALSARIFLVSRRP